jgi:hypothetical protein
MPLSIVNILRFISILEWERLPSFARYGYVEIIKCLMIKTLLWCKLFTDVVVYFVYSRLYICGKLRSVHEGLCTVKGYDEEYFFLTCVAT